MNLNIAIANKLARLSIISSMPCDTKKTHLNPLILINMFEITYVASVKFLALKKTHAKLTRLNVTNICQAFKKFCLLYPK
jgi:hypothetical protein